MGIGFYTQLPSLPSLPSIEEKETISVHSIVVEKVTGMGKMELVKIEFQDVVTHEVQIDYLPDPKVMLKVFGETVACVDFAQIDSANIHVQGDTLLLDMPAPEICYSKIDHEQSEIVETWYTSIYQDGQKLIDQAYEISERKMTEAAISQDIYGQAEVQAEKMLAPLLAQLTQKQVFLRFPTVKEVPMPAVPAESEPIKPESVR